MGSMTHAGIGFSKTAEGNLELMAGLQCFRRKLLPPLLNMPILAGPSRKRFLGDIIGELKTARCQDLLGLKHLDEEHQEPYTSSSPRGSSLN